MISLAAGQIAGVSGAEGLGIKSTVGALRDPVTLDHIGVELPATAGEGEYIKLVVVRILGLGIGSAEVSGRENC